MILVPGPVAVIVLTLVRVLLVVAFVREAVLRFKDVPGFAENDGVPLPVAWFVPIAVPLLL